MDDQQLYKATLPANNSESLYYQQVQVNSQALNHSYESVDMNESSSSPHLSQESMDVTARTKNTGLVDSARQTGWVHSASGNNVEGRINLGSYEQSLSWSSQPQNEIAGAYQLAYYPQQKVTSGALHKLDSFTQVFARQNLRIQSLAQGVHEKPSPMDTDSALRQLLSLKPTAEQPTLANSVDRYQQAPQQMQQNLGNQQQKHHPQALPHPQQNYYYDYPQHVSQIQSQLMQQGQQFVQQVQPHQALQQQQTQYYMHPSQSGEQRVAVQEMQQQQVLSGQMSQYYQVGAAGAEMHRAMQQQQSRRIPVQTQSYHRNHSQAAAHYPQEPPRSMQLIQLGAVPQYVYPNSQPFHQLYKQNLLALEQQMQQEASPQKPYHGESRTVLMDAAAGLTDTLDSYNGEETAVMGNPTNLHSSQEASYLVNSHGPHQSPDAAWPQHMADAHSQTSSPDPSRSLCPERPDSQTRLQCSVCFKEFRSLPALNGHLRSHGGSRTSSVVKQEIARKLQLGASKSFHPEESLKPQPERRKYRHRPEPLFIPPPSFNMNVSFSGATLYQSQLRSPRVMGDHPLLRTHELPTYTPPPMLSPARLGSGLFSSVITASHNEHLPLTPPTPTPRVLLGRPNSIDDGGATVTPGPGEKTVDVEPRINIGSRFQAEIPELKGPSCLGKEQHKATLVWKPWPDLENKESQQRVEVFLSMSCSSVLPGGGTNLEYALHSLFQANGNVLSALEMLLLGKPLRLKDHPLANYHYAGSDRWTSTEKKIFKKALNTCNKDFFHVQKMIKSKTVSQCVEYYYTWKKILHMGRRHRSRHADGNEDDTTSVDDLEEEEDTDDRKYEEEVEPAQKSPELLPPTDLDQTAPPALGPPSGSFVCEMGNCGAIFCSRQALNGHARIHGGTNVPAKIVPAAASAKQKSSNASGYCSVKSSPAHSTTSGETDPATIFPCKVCGKVFFKIKSRNAHMKTHRQQEELQRQKAQKAAEVADAITRTIVINPVPGEHCMIPFDRLNLIKAIEQEFDDVAQDLEDVLEETQVMHSDLLLDDEDVDLLQDATDL
ncbi:transcriptional-regulating factor 1 isoform X2 [Spea bombifrons]|uniref:transcriptional-regulating factor 1 isoform X2 n=1 Tax=Spea bombifrons TaxID=233779 RepID=UPI00234B51BA|nr:transcriptional-regulating factor 1 isoform X2 [Spea bombifrons]